MKRHKERDPFAEQVVEALKARKENTDELTTSSQLPRPAKSLYRMLDPIDRGTLVLAAALLTSAVAVTVGRLL